MKMIIRFCEALGKRLVAVLIIGLLMTSPLQGLVGAEPTGTWVDGSMPQVAVGAKTLDPAATSCFPTSFMVHSYTNASGAFDSIGRDVEKSVCATQNELGFFGSTGGATDPYSYDFIKPNTTNAFRVLNHQGNPSGIVPVPGQKSFFYSHPDGHPYGGRSLRSYNNFPSAGTFGPAYGNVNELAFKLKSPLPEPLRDSVNNIIYINAYAFSASGEWMIFEAFGTGIVRLNTQTHAMQLVSTERYNYGQGFRPVMTFAISDDGNSVVRSGFNTNATAVYDLSGCQPTPIKPASGSTVLAPGCRSRDVQASLVQQHSGFIGLIQMRFSGNGQSVTGVLSSTSVTGAREYYNMTYAVAGYQPQQLSYLALGDSFSSGEGAYDYEAGTDSNDPRNKCHLSTGSYPYLAAQELSIGDFRSVACSGAMLENYFDKPQYGGLTSATLPGFKVQQDSLLEASSVSVITLSMVGNDIGFSNKIRRCLIGPDSCFHFKEDRQSIADEIYAKFDKLTGLYESIKTDSQDARVYVLGYPRIVSAEGECGLNMPLDAEERQMTRGLTTYLNSVIKAATEKAGVQYIDLENAFAGHQLCEAGTKAVNGLTAGNDIVLNIGPIGNESFHPNKLGHQLMSQALLSQSQNLTKEMPAAISGKIAPYVGSVPYTAFLGSAPSGGIFTRATYTALEGLEVVLPAVPFLPEPTEQFLKPSSAFEVWFNSTPVHAGTLNTDANGELMGEITVPASLPPGYHTLHIYGQNIAGENIDLYKTVYVAASESDFDGDGVPNSEEKCLAVDPANVDADRDGIDDACDAEISELPADTTPPAIVGSPDRQPNAAGWYDADVTVTWNATDPDPSSGTPTQPAATNASLEGENTYTSDPSCDPLNNCATGNLSLKIDKTAPNISYSLSPAANEGGWNNDAVTVNFHCQDSVSGVANCTPPETLDSPDGMYVVTGTAADRAGNTASINAFVSIDRTKPIITQTVTPAANPAGWHNTDATVTPECTDELAGLASCGPPQTVEAEGANQLITSTAVDNAGNTASATTHINVDKTPPSIGGPAWTNNPKPVSSTAMLQIVASDSLSGLAEAEYFLGDTDPGQGHGATVHIVGDTLTVDFGADFPTGVYKVSVRAKDNAGNWSPIVSDYLVVYNPDGVRMTGKRTVLPSLANGDILPGLISATQTNKAKFGFNVKYDSQGNIHSHSDLQFSYDTGTKCNNPAQASNCHSLELNATSIAWLTTQGANNSTGIFQGIATLNVDGTTNNVQFRLTGLDGERLNDSSEDRLTLMIYNQTDNPNTATPIYQVSADVMRGNIRVRVQ